MCSGRNPVLTGASADRLGHALRTVRRAGCHKWARPQPRQCQHFHWAGVPVPSRHSGRSLRCSRVRHPAVGPPRAHGSTSTTYRHIPHEGRNSCTRSYTSMRMRDCVRMHPHAFDADRPTHMLRLSRPSCSPRSAAKLAAESMCAAAAAPTVCFSAAAGATGAAVRRAAALQWYARR